VRGGVSHEVVLNAIADCQHTGSNNLVVGNSAGNALTSGQGNTLLGGTTTGDVLTTGSFNILIGATTNVSDVGAAGRIAIGFGAIATADNQCVIGSADSNGLITDLYLGEGVTVASPGNMTVHGTGASGTDDAAANFTFAGGQGTGTGVGGHLIFQTAGAGSTGTGLNSLTTRLVIDDEGLNAFTGRVNIIQSVTNAAAPVVTLDQADVDEDYFKFIGTSDTSADRALVDAVNFTTPGAIVGWLKCNVQDDQATAPIVDGDYYIPFYAVPTA